MSRLHIPFRFGKSTGVSAGHIRALANQTRDLALAADTPLPGEKRKVRLEPTLKLLGGRIGPRPDMTLPMEEQLALEVWGPGDFVLHEPADTVIGNNRLACFAYIGSYILHYQQCAEDKWTENDGSYVGMQWARTGGKPRELHGLAMKEAYGFAASLLAPVSEMKKAIEAFGPDDFHIVFQENLRREVVIKRARSLGLLSPLSQTA